ncbi:MAG: hypothetical protein KAY24_05260 [Candidatus Eisenbacteria sp.]|nr:hypothetical protein [Candidatus Eisenbacteria bacterium]
MPFSKCVSSVGCAVACAVLFPPATAGGNEGTNDYTCFSMKAAQAAIQSPHSILSDEVQELGFITYPMGAMIDTTNQDLILIGRQRTDLPPLFLDDLVTQMRGLISHGNAEPPGVSIDPDTIGDSNRQVVTYFAGIGGSRFGRVCFEADYLLKRMTLGLVPIGVPEIQTPWVREREWTKAHGAGEGRYPFRSIFFFVPDQARLAKSREAVMLHNCDVRLASHFVLGKGTWSNPRLLPRTARLKKQWGLEFAEAFSEHYDEIAQAHPVLEELRSLVRLYAICQVVMTLKVPPDLDFWLNEYTVGHVETPFSVQIVQHGEAGLGFAISSQGGLYLRSLATRVGDGDPSAFAKAVLLTRPSPQSVSWPLCISPGQSEARLTPARTHAQMQQSGPAEAANRLPSSIAERNQLVRGRSNGPSHTGTVAEEPPAANPAPLGFNLLETCLSLGLKYDLGNTYDPPTAILFGLAGNTVLSAEISTALVLGNRLRLRAIAPFEIRSALVSASDGHEYGMKALAIAAGMGSLRLGSFYLLTSRHRVRSRVLLNFDCVLPMGGKIYEKYWTDRRGQYSVPSEQRIGIAQRNLTLIGGLMGDSRVLDQLYVCLSCSMLIQCGRSPKRAPGIGIALRSPLSSKGPITAYGLECVSVWTDDRKNAHNDRHDLRAKAILCFHDNEIAVGIGTTGSDNDKLSGVYGLFSWDISRSVLNHRHWF